MADYYRFGTVLNLFNGYSGLPFAQTLVSQSATEFRFRNDDGSVTIATGTGFVWNAAAKTFTAGTVTGLRHEAGGEYVDKVLDLDVSAAALQSAFEQADSDFMGLHSLIFGGNDWLDARYREGNAVTPVTMWGMAGNDTVLGGVGGDVLVGGGGDDVVAGGGGKDFLYGDQGDDELVGGAGADKLQAGFGEDAMIGGAGNDLFHGGGDDDFVNGGGGKDVVVHHSGWFEMEVARNGGTFTVSSYSGEDTLTGVEMIATDTGIYRWTPASQQWLLVSTTPGEVLLNPSERLRGTNGADAIDTRDLDKSIVQALGGNDIVQAGESFDLILGGNGRDLVKGDDLTGGEETSSIDRLYGEAGNDTLWGGGGDDRLYGGAGADQLHGGEGYDVLGGGAGADVFNFRWSTHRQTAETWGHDVVTDFDLGVDRLALRYGPNDSGQPDLVETPDGLLLVLQGAGSILLEHVNGDGIILDDLLV